MDALSFVAGLATGIKNGGVNEEIVDPDLAIWETLPEPDDNGSVFLVRIIDTAQKVRIPFQYENTNIEYSVRINWGDGEETFVENDVYFPYCEHIYSAPGDYIVTVISGNIENFKAWFLYCYSDTGGVYANSWRMAKYGENVLLEKAYNGFYNMSGREKLKYIKISSKTELTTKFFQGCYIVRKIEYNKILDSIPDYAFYGCQALVLDWDLSKVKSIGANAFYQNFGLPSVDFFPSCQEIGANAFRYCYGLQNVKLESCIMLGNEAFKDCYNLQKVDLPNCTTVGSLAFSGNRSLVFTNFAENCTFGTNAFSGCDSLYPIPT